MSRKSDKKEMICLGEEELKKLEMDMDELVSSLSKGPIAVRTALSFYVTEFNHLNDCKLKKNYLFCFECESLLTTTIYLNPKQMVNICASCMESKQTAVGDKEVTDWKQNEILEEQLRFYQFPCIYVKCNYLSDYANVAKHMELCMCGPIKCPLDNEEFEHFGAFVGHLSLHGNLTKTKFENRSFTIKFELKNDFKHEIVFATYEGHYFLAVLSNLPDMVLLKVSKHLYDKTSTINVFNILYKFDDMRISHSGKLVSLQELFNNDDIENYVVLRKALLNEEVKLTIQFRGHDFVPNHAKDDYIFCGNQKHGCLEIVHSRNNRKHMDLCNKQLFDCPMCYKSILINELGSHFVKVHNQITHNNYSTFQWKLLGNNGNISNHEYITYRSSLFKVSVQYSGQHNYSEGKLIFRVEVLNKNTEKIMYIYEIIIIHNDYILKKVTNVCGFSSTIELGEMVKYFQESSCQINILYNKKLN